MILYINTASYTDIEVKIMDRKKVIAESKIKTERTQAEKLLPLIDKLLKKAKLKLKNLQGIEVENQGGSFTSLRIGVATANALGFALGIPVLTHPVPAEAGPHGNLNFDIVAPVYDREPDIK